MKFLSQAQALQFHASLQAAFQFVHFQFQAFLLGDIFNYTDDKCRLIVLATSLHHGKDALYPENGTIT
ncbi:MAG TPA: hypothetical protein VIV15_05075, partial [Anaerolineales bacterium]